MFIRKMDTITPPITLFFKGKNRHSTIFSGILALIIQIILFVFTVIYFLDYINKKSPTAFYFNKFINDSGELYFNSSSLFHYVYLVSKTDKNIPSFNFDTFRIIGLEQINIDTYYTSVDLSKTTHWLYGICNNDNVDMESFSELIPQEEKENSACIRKYYNPKTKKYYDITDKNNFIWPSIAHGMSNENFTYYGIIVEKCKDDELRTLAGYGSCKSSEEIYNSISSNAIILKFIDHNPDVLNYKEPFAKYFYSISNLLYQSSYTVNHININPALIKTHNGIFFDNVIEENSYLFEQNEKVTFKEEIELTDELGNLLYDESGNIRLKSTGIISSYYFWMQNRLQIYQRNYKKFQDVLSSIGGLSRMLLLIARIFNALIPGYITLLDTEELLISLNNDKLSNQTPISLYKKDVASPPKKQNNNNYFQQASNMLRSSKEVDSIMHNTFTGIEKSEQKKNENMKERNLINNYNLNSEDNKIVKEKTDKKDLIKIKKYNNNIHLETENNELVNDKKEEYEKDKLIEKQNFNWFIYIWNKIYCGKKNPHISYYEGYRKKIISEEGIFKGSLDIYNLLQFVKLDTDKDINSIKDNNININNNNKK